MKKICVQELVILECVTTLYSKQLLISTSIVSFVEYSVASQDSCRSRIYQILRGCSLGNAQAVDGKSQY